MGSDENIPKTVKGFIEKNNPDMVGILTSSLSEVKGDDVASVIRDLNRTYPGLRILHIPTADYEGGLETGYTRAVEALIALCSEKKGMSPTKGHINVLPGSHLTPADFTELREIIESFGLVPIVLPDLSALDGSRQGISPLAVGGTTVDEISLMSASEFTIAIGLSMERPAKLLKGKCGIEYRVFESIAGLKDTDVFMKTLSILSGRPVSKKYERQRRILMDGMRDAHFYYGNKRVCIALDPDLVLQTSRWLDEIGAVVDTVVLPHRSPAEEKIPAKKVIVGDLFSIEGEFDLLLSNSHAEETAKRLGIPLYQMGFPTYKILANNSRITIGYRGSMTAINDMANLLMRSH
jgi:nitrogenase molybdenum-iron cofactor biosynthesis protein NifN